MVWSQNYVNCVNMKLKNGSDQPNKLMTYRKFQNLKEELKVLLSVVWRRLWETGRWCHLKIKLNQKKLNLSGGFNILKKSSSYFPVFKDLLTVSIYVAVNNIICIQMNRAQAYTMPYSLCLGDKQLELCIIQQYVKERLDTFTWHI